MCRTGVHVGVRERFRALLQVLLALCLTAAASTAVQAGSPSPTAERRMAVAKRAGSAPVYRIPVRVHLSKSGKTAEEFHDILEEINEIWLDQAGICFAMQIADSEERGAEGMDLWFMPILPGGMWLNGYYRDDHDIFVRNRPELGPAEHPARHPAARTAAHELGHGLGLRHRQDSDDNLMRSKSYGWQLNDAEIRLARETAKKKAPDDREGLQCGPLGHSSAASRNAVPSLYEPAR